MEFLDWKAMERSLISKKVIEQKYIMHIHTAHGREEQMKI